MPYPKEDEIIGGVILKFIAFIIIFTLFLAFVRGCEAQEYTDEQIVNAIYKAEGGDKAQYPYGIRSIKTDNPRQVCFNTVRNQRERHRKHSCGLTYIECLANRYCPIGAKNDPRGLNKNWLKNVKFFLTYCKN